MKTAKGVWEKLGAETPKSMIESDATIVAPLIFAYVMADTPVETLIYVQFLVEDRRQSLNPGLYRSLC